jgi:hypothetical protein
VVDCGLGVRSLSVLPMSNPVDTLSKKTYALVIKRKGKSGLTSNTLLFYAERQAAEEYATKILTPDEEVYLSIECVIFECDLYHCGNPLAFISNNETCYGVPNFTPTK